MMDSPISFVVERFFASDIDSKSVSDLSLLITELRGKHTLLTADHLQKMVQESYVVVARQIGPVGAIIGHACLCYLDVLQGRHAIIESVIVRSDCRRQGIASAMIHSLIKEAACNDIANVRLTCNPSRIDARRLYQELGFSPANTTVFDYRLTA